MALSGGEDIASTENAQPNGNPARPTATCPVAASIGAAAVKGPGRTPASCRSWMP